MKKSTFRNQTRLHVWLKALCLLILSGWSWDANAQIPVTVTGTAVTSPALAASYTSLANALTALNAVNSYSTNGTIVFTCAAGSSETAPATGLTIGSATLNPLLSAVNTVTIVKASGTVTLNAGVGTATPATVGAHDGILNLIGADYITVDGLSFVDGNAANPATMEYGIGLFKASVTDGCQFNTIVNCTITLNRINFVTGTAPSANGSTGINIVNCTQAAQTVALSVTAASGTNSNNKIYSNTVQNCNVGMNLVGFAALTPFTNADQSNDIGGSSSATANNVINFGGGALATNTAIGINTSNQYGINISYNTINNNNGSGVNHVVAITGILNGAATSANATITFNTVTLKGGGTTTALIGISNAAGSTAAGNTIAINSNTITGFTYTTSTTGGITGIVNSGSPANLNVNSNTFTNNATSASGTATNTMISNTGAPTVSLNINSNNFNGWVFNGTLAATYNGISSGAITTATLSISNNNFQAITYATSGTGAHIYIGWQNGTNTTASVNSNTFTNLNVNTTGSVTFFNRGTNSMTATGSLSVSSNQVVTGFNKGGAGGTVTFFTNGGGASSPAGATIIDNLNNFSNVTCTGATSILCWSNADGPSGGGCQKTITNNTFNNISTGAGTITGISFSFCGTGANISNNTISNMTAAGNIIGMTGSSNGGTINTVANNLITNLTSTGGAINGIQSSSTGTTTLNVNNNAIRSLSTNFLGAQINGIIMTGGITNNVFKNTICDLQSNSATGTVNGITATAGTTNNISNNRMGDLRTPTANAANPLSGINITGGTTANVFFNTVNLNAVSSGALFGSSAITVSTTPTVTLGNNIFVNNSTPNTTGLTVAYRRTSTTITSYGSLSDRNLFYAGVPGPNNLIHNDGTNSFQTLAAYKAMAVPGVLAPRDANSVTENPTFLSSSCGNAGFLKITPNVPTLVESGGANITGITDDFEGDIRAGNPGYLGIGTTPDIGADEFDPVLPNCSAAVGGSITPSTQNKCIGQSVSMTAVGATTGTGITYQWETSAIGGGVGFGNVVGGSGANSLSYSSPALSAGIYYYRLKVTCSFGPLTGFSNELTVTVNGLPTVTLATVPFNALICGTGSVSITASGASTYAWSPTTNLAPTSGSPVVASPTTTTSYTVTGTDINGCTNTATRTIVVGPALTMGSVTATPASVCSGANSQLSAAATANPSANYTVSSIAPTAITPSGGSTVLATGGVATPTQSGNTLDDGYWDNISLPFSFNFYGVTYTTIRIGTNGNVQFGPVVSTSGNPGNSSWTPQTIPTAGGNLDNFIGCPWTDHDLSTSPFGTLRYFTEGSAPNRKFVVSYENAKVFNSTDNNTSQIILNENGTIDALLLGGGLVSTAAKAIGIENANGTLGVSPPNRNSGTWTTAADEGWRFTPPSLNFSWSPSTFLNSTSIANPIAQNVTSNVTYTVTATDGVSGCSITSTTTLTSGSPLACNAPTNTTACAGANFTVTGYPVGGGAPYSYAWSDGVGGVYPNANPITVNLASGTYTITCTISDACGSTCTATKVVMVNSLPAVTLVSSSLVNCLPGSGVALTAGGALSYTYSPTTSLTPTSGSSVNANPSTATSYTVTGTDGNGCVKTASVNLTIGATVTMNSVSASPNTFCNNGSSILTANATMPISGYCAAGASTLGCSGTDEAISNVTFGSINNTSVCATVAPQYENFTSLSTAVVAGNTYPISVTNVHSFSGDSITVWIDYNQNGSFTDPGEATSVPYVHITSGVNTSTGNITIPLTALNGTTRMRIRLDFNQTTHAPCGILTFGEVEDYSVVISGGVNPVSPLTYAWSQSGSSSLGGSTTNTESATNITANTTYTVVATSAAGCSASGSVSVTNAATTSSINVTSPTSCYTWPVTGMSYSSNGSYTGTLVNANAAGCDSIITMNLTRTPGITLSVKAILAGCYDASLGMMHDSLRINGLIPSSEPYSIPPFNRLVLGVPNGETVSAGVLAVTGSNAIVDWVYLELRDAMTPSMIVATKRALIQRDGDIVSSADGMSPVFFPGFASGNYYLSLKHRNHLGIMTASPVALGACPNGVIDFTSIPVWVKPGEMNAPRRMIGAVAALWAADANTNKNVKYNGLSNDKQEVLTAVGVGTPNNVISSAYRPEDLNLDSKIKYNGFDNDRNVIANMVGVSTPNNIVNQHTPN